MFSLLLNIASLKLRIKHVTEEQLRHFVIYSAFKKKLFGSGNGCSFQGSKCLGKEPRIFGSEFNCSVQTQARWIQKHASASDPSLMFVNPLAASGWFSMA